MTLFNNILYDSVFVVLGSFVGFFISEAKTKADLKKKYNQTRISLSKYTGNYSISAKSGKEPLLKEVQIDINDENTLCVTLKTSYNGIAKGHVQFNESTLTFGTVHYRHLEQGKEHLSGTYYLFFIEDGLIHATKYYVSEQSEEIREVFILRRDKNKN